MLYITYCLIHCKLPKTTFLTFDSTVLTVHTDICTIKLKSCIKNIVIVCKNRHRNIVLSVGISHKVQC